MLFSAFMISADTKNPKEFKDINEVMWAKDYINEVAKVGIVKGYTDGTFRPKKKVTKSESVLMLYRMIDGLGLVGEVDEDALMKKHVELMDKNNIPTWQGLRPAIAYFLEEKIIPAKDLSGFLRDGMQVYINREQMASYLGSILKRYTEVKDSGVVDLKYKDGAKINPNYAAAVGLLYEKKVFTGDKNNNFNPKNSITRAETAKVIIQTIKVLKEEADVKEKPPVIKETKVDGIITSKLESKLIVKTADKILHLDISPDMPIMMNDTIIKLDDLKRDMDIVLVYKAEQLVRIEAKPMNMVVKTGIVSGKIDNSTYQVVYYRQQPDGKMVELILEPSYILRRDGVKTMLKEVEKSDKIDVNYKNGKVYSVDFSRKDKIAEAKVREVVIGTEKKLNVLMDGKEKTLIIPKGTEIYRNGGVSLFKSLKVDDEIKIYTTYGDITKISAKSIIKTVEASLKQIFIGEDISITVWVDGDKNKKKVFKVVDDVDVYIDNKIARLVDIAIDSMIDIKLDGKEIIEISTYKRLMKTFDAKITEIDFVDKTLIAKDKDSQKVYTVKVNQDTKILNSDGDVLTFEDLLQGDEIYIKGYTKGNDFIAKSIIQL